MPVVLSRFLPQLGPLALAQLGPRLCSRWTAGMNVSSGEARWITPCLCTQLTHVRHFGRSKPTPIFGHRQQNLPRWTFIPGVFIISSMLLAVLDWNKIYEDTGFYIPILGNILLDDTGDLRRNKLRAVDAGMPNPIDVELYERRHDIHDFMMEEAKVKHGERVEEAEREARPEDEKNLEFLEMLNNSRRVKAKEAAAVVAEVGVEVDGLAVEEIAEKKAVQGFRSRKIMEYENRIRQYSTPDKIFRYFATYRVTDEKGHVEVMMTPEDFLRSITPGMKQPEHLGLDQFTTVNVDVVERLSVGVEESSIFYQLGAGGLISFSDYIFLLTVLSTSRRHFEIAFKMFDLNGDGDVDAKEFEVVTNLMKSQSSMGARHRDHGNTGSNYKGINSGLINFFFGEEKEGILTVGKFLEFQRRLQNEILALEFRRKLPSGASNDADHITEKEFAELLIAYAGFPAKKRAKMLKRVRREFHGEDSAEKAKGITMADYLHFYQVLYSINDIDTALTFYHIAGAPIERETMKHVAKTVAGVDLSDHVTNVVFVLFDENGDGKLSNKEFVSVMKQRAMRGLEKPKDTGIGKIFSAVTKCAGDTRPTILGGMRKTE